MIIYSRILEKKPGLHHLFKHENMKHLDHATYEKDAVYSYDQHDRVLYNQSFNNFIDDTHWDHIKTDSTAKILLFFGDEYFSLSELTDWARTILAQKINPKQVYIVVLNEFWKTWAEKKFLERMPNIPNIQAFSLLLKRTAIIDDNIKPKHRFTALSRNYNLYRTNIYLELVNRSIVSQFNYTFNNILPYGGLKIISEEQMLQDAADLGYDSNSKKIKKWIGNIPYTMSDYFVNDVKAENCITNKMDMQTYNLIQSGNIHLLIESHYDPFWTYKGLRQSIPIQEFAPSFPTEKTWKAMSANRPFIAFTTPYFMKELREQGYKTFSPLIDESYDEIEDNDKRLQAIANEFERLAMLNPLKFANLNTRLSVITKHNRELFIQQHNDVIFKDNFLWVDKLFDHDKLEREYS